MKQFLLCNSYNAMLPDEVIFPSKNVLKVSVNKQKLFGTLTSLINGHAHLFFLRNNFHPTRWFSCNRLKIPSYPFNNLVLVGRLDFPSYPFIKAYPCIREVRVIENPPKDMIDMFFYLCNKKWTENKLLCCLPQSIK